MNQTSNAALGYGLRFGLVVAASFWINRSANNGPIMQVAALLAISIARHAQASRAGFDASSPSYVA